MDVRDFEKVLAGTETQRLFPELKTVAAHELMALFKLAKPEHGAHWSNAKIFAAGVVLGLRLAKGRL